MRIRVLAATLLLLAAGAAPTAQASAGEVMDPVGDSRDPTMDIISFGLDYGSQTLTLRATILGPQAPGERGSERELWFQVYSYPGDTEGESIRSDEAASLRTASPRPADRCQSSDTFDPATRTLTRVVDVACLGNPVTLHAVARVGRWDYSAGLMSDQAPDAHTLGPAYRAIAPSKPASVRPARYCFTHAGVTTCSYYGVSWYLSSGAGQPASHSMYFGAEGDRFLVGDWNGDRWKTPGVFRNGRWYLGDLVTITQPASAELVFGSGGDVPIAGDWDGDGVDSPGVFRDGRWFLRNSLTSGPGEQDFIFGQAGDTPMVADWDGDGKDDPGIFRAGQWFIRYSMTSGPDEAAIVYGQAGDRPMPGDWDGDGDFEPGVTRGATWFLRDHFSSGPATSSFVYGNPGDSQLVWR